MGTSIIRGGPRRGPRSCQDLVSARALNQPFYLSTSHNSRFQGVSGGGQSLHIEASREQLSFCRNHCGYRACGMASTKALNSSAPEYVPPSAAPATPRDARQGLSVRLPTEDEATPRHVAKNPYHRLDRVPFTPGAENLHFLHGSCFLLRPCAANVG